METPARARRPNAHTEAEPCLRPREDLLLGNPREVLARIVPDDALGLRGLIASRLIERALLADVDSLLLRAQALCALRAPAWRGEPALERWLEDRLSEALEGLLSTGELHGSGREPRDRGLDATSLGLDPVEFERACARFNRLPFEHRSAFFALVLDASEPDRLARAQGLSLSQLARRARTALQLFRTIASAAEAAS